MQTIRQTHPVRIDFQYIAHVQYCLYTLNKEFVKDSSYLTVQIFLLFIELITVSAETVAVRDGNVTSGELYTNIRLRLSLKIKSSKMHLCFNKNWKLVGMVSLKCFRNILQPRTLSTIELCSWALIICFRYLFYRLSFFILFLQRKKRNLSCYFHETFVNGYFQYHSEADHTKHIGFYRNGRPIKFAARHTLNDSCNIFFKQTPNDNRSLQSSQKTQLLNIYNKNSTLLRHDKRRKKLYHNRNNKQIKNVTNTIQTNNGTRSSTSFSENGLSDGLLLEEHKISGRKKLTTTNGGSYLPHSMNETLIAMKPNQRHCISRNKNRHKRRKCIPFQWITRNI